MQDEFKSLGLELTKFVVENISLPQEVEAAMDKRTSMGVLGDMGKYTQFEAAQAMRDAAQNPSGGAGLGAGLGAGFAVGNAMAGAMTDAMKQKGVGTGELRRHATASAEVRQVRRRNAARREIL